MKEDMHVCTSRDTDQMVSPVLITLKKLFLEKTGNVL